RSSPSRPCFCYWFGPPRALPSFPTRRSSDLLPWILASAFGIGLLLVVVLWSPWRKSAQPAPVRRTTIELGGDVPLYPYTAPMLRSEEHTSELQSRENLVCRLLLEKKKHQDEH